MDPKLFDILWAVHREVGSNAAIQIFSAYRSPDTNAMLRRRSKAVAKNSQHMEGKALDFNLPDVGMDKVRGVGMRLQRGGVGYYPNVPFVHLDTGSVRSWPRMPRTQLARLFPDGRTVHIPADGTPLDGYALAQADIEARGDRISGAVFADAGAPTGRRRSLWTALFGGAEEEDEEVVAPARTPRRTVVAAARQPVPQAAQQTAYAGGDSASPTSFLLQSNNRQQPVAVAARPQPQPAPAPVQVAVATPAPAPQRVTQPTLSQQPLALNSFASPSSAGAPTIPAPRPVARPDDLTPPAQPTTVAALAPAAVASFANVPLPPQRPSEAAAPAPAAPVAPVAPTLVDLPLPPVRPATAVAEARPSVAAPSIPVPVAEATKPSEALVALAAAGQAVPSAAQARTTPPMAMSFAPIGHPVPPMRPALAQPVRTAQADTGQADTGQVDRDATNREIASSTSPARQPAAPANPLQPLFKAEVTHTRPVRKPNVVVSQARLVTVSDRPVAQKPEQVVSNSFAKTSGDDLSITKFTGPAVKPLSTVQFSTR